VGEFLPGYEASQWVGIGAPKNTPAQIIEKLNEAINAGLAEPKIIARRRQLGQSPGQNRFDADSDEVHPTSPRPLLTARLSSPAAPEARISSCAPRADALATFAMIFGPSRLKCSHIVRERSRRGSMNALLQEISNDLGGRVLGG
jgi:hypothetical protein